MHIHTGTFRHIFFGKSLFSPQNNMHVIFKEMLNVCHACLRNRTVDVMFLRFLRQNMVECFAILEKNCFENCISNFTGSSRNLTNLIGPRPITADVTRRMESDGVEYVEYSAVYSRITFLGIYLHAHELTVILG